MSKRRISNGTVNEIGVERIGILLDLSEQAVRDGMDDRARRYVEIARNIGMKTRASIPKDRKYCKACHIPLMAGVTCTVRLSGHKVCIRCDRCGEVRRIPYIKEQRS